MESFFIVGLIITVVLLWRRLERVEAKLTELEWAQANLAYNAPVAAEMRAVDEPPVERLSEFEAMPDIPELVPSWERIEAIPEEPSSEEPVESVASYPPRLKLDFEDVFGRRLPIWAGGIALAVAGIFLVRYSIEAGLMTPAMRVLLSFVFGVILLTGAEAAYRFESRVRDPRVRQALAGAGLATLYAGFYLAGTRYGLIGAGASFVWLAAVTAAAILLSFRFGLPCAVLGLVGGFAAPVLVASEEANVPILTLYLALVIAGLTITGQRQGRPWLGYGALAFGFLWGTALLTSSLELTGDLLALGLYVVVLGTVLPLLAGADRRWARLAAAGFASLQLAVLIDLTGQDPLTWGLYLVLGAGLAALSWRDAQLREASAFAAALALWMLSFWTEATLGHFAPVAAGVATLFIAVPLALVRLGRAGKIEVPQISLAAPALTMIAYAQFGDWGTVGPEPGQAAVAAGLALLPALAARYEWRHPTGERLLTLPIGSAAALVFASLLMLLPAWTAPGAAMAVALVVVRLSHRRPSLPMLDLTWLAAGVGMAALAATPEFLAETNRLAGVASDAEPGRAVIRWLAAGLPFLGLAWLETRRFLRHGAEALLAVAAYGALAQVLPRDALPWACALAGMAVLARLPQREGGWGAWSAITALWSAVPLAAWTLRGSSALGGQPMLLASSEATWHDALLRLSPLVAAAGFAAWTLRDRNRPVAIWIGSGAAFVGLVAAHVLYKQLFALGSLADFVRHGLAERTVWQGLLAGAGLLALRHGREGAARIAGIALLSLALAHFGWFTLLLHNPLWQAQEVGPWPLANWLLPAYAVAAVATVVLERLARPERPWLALGLEAALMALIALLALSELRHLHSGTLLTAGSLGQGEDLMRSLLGIVLALLFLWWGSRTGQRHWRIGSLVLMLLAVGKVFLVDAAGLEGLLRIASFMALGFSLIGIGWVYSRQLLTRPAPAAA